MSELGLNQKWTSTSMSTGELGAPVDVSAAIMDAVFYMTVSSLCTATFELQSSPDSTGPWVVEGTTSVSASSVGGAVNFMRFTGPFGYVRPVLAAVGASTGFFTCTIKGTN